MVVFSVESKKVAYLVLKNKIRIMALVEAVER